MTTLWEARFLEDAEGEVELEVGCTEAGRVEREGPGMDVSGTCKLEEKGSIVDMRNKEPAELGMRRC